MTTVSVAQFRSKMARILDNVVRKKERIILEKSNVPIGVLINYNDYTELIEELEDLALACNPKVIERIKEAKKDKKEGRTRSLSEFAKELGI